MPFLLHLGVACSLRSLKLFDVRLLPFNQSPSLFLLCFRHLLRVVGLPALFLLCILQSLPRPHGFPLSLQTRFSLHVLDVLCKHRRGELLSLGERVGFLLVFGLLPLLFLHLSHLPLLLELLLLAGECVLDPFVDRSLLRILLLTPHRLVPVGLVHIHQGPLPLQLLLELLVPRLLRALSEGRVHPRLFHVMCGEQVCPLLLLSLVAEPLLLLHLLSLGLRSVPLVLQLFLLELHLSLPALIGCPLLCLCLLGLLHEDPLSLALGTASAFSCLGFVRLRPRVHVRLPLGSCHGLLCVPLISLVHLLGVQLLEPVQIPLLLVESVPISSLRESSVPSVRSVSLARLIPLYDPAFPCRHLPLDSPPVLGVDEASDLRARYRPHNPLPDHLVVDLFSNQGLVLVLPLQLVGVLPRLLLYRFPLESSHLYLILTVEGHLLCRLLLLSLFPFEEGLCL